MITREDYDPDFDDNEGMTESPDPMAARVALAESATGGAATQRAIEESQSWIEQLRTIRVENHFNQKIRTIIQSQRSA